jgi:hypothetical protein
MINCPRCSTFLIQDFNVSWGFYCPKCPNLHLFEERFAIKWLIYYFTYQYSVSSFKYRIEVLFEHVAVYRADTQYGERLFYLEQNNLDELKILNWSSSEIDRFVEEILIFS